MLPFSAGRIRMVRWCGESEMQIFLDLERFGCCWRVNGNLESEMFAKMWEM